MAVRCCWQEAPDRDGPRRSQRSLRPRRSASALTNCTCTSSTATAAWVISRGCHTLERSSPTKTWSRSSDCCYCLRTSYAVALSDSARWATHLPLRRVPTVNRCPYSRCFSTVGNDSRSSMSSYKDAAPSACSRSPDQRRPAASPSRSLATGKCSHRASFRRSPPSLPCRWRNVATTRCSGSRHATSPRNAFPDVR